MIKTFELVRWCHAVPYFCTVHTSGIFHQRTRLKKWKSSCIRMQDAELLSRTAIAKRSLVDPIEAQYLINTRGSSLILIILSR